MQYNIQINTIIQYSATQRNGTQRDATQYNNTAQCFTCIVLSFSLQLSKLRPRQMAREKPGIRFSRLSDALAARSSVLSPQRIWYASIVAIC
eukprot:9042504-Lingulodinium_polyedra.AAC.1